MSSPAQLLVPKMLMFSSKRSSVQKAKDKQFRAFNDQHSKLLGKCGPLKKLPGVRRSKKEGLASSVIEQCVNVVDNSVDGKLREVDFVDQWQGLFSETFCGGDASPLVDNV
ncbi:hypothetical protein MA16_Dca009769 [Dendrobium catenatum]|uniref:Uncharacterized protein n=1 Tax=Dendrobium catenatum TaxID=906689 RepID=A0A2I0VZ67_9ASPA|nr:hypothetical protein MA16_Dca009769 [Dendrobium catenatum]